MAVRFRECALMVDFPAILDFENSIRFEQAIATHNQKKKSEHEV